MPRKQSLPYKPHQRRAKGSKSWNPMFHDLMDSPAYHDLTPKQKVLYCYCVRESHGSAAEDATRAGKPYDERLFYMNRELACDRHGLYTRGDRRGMVRDMAALVEHGFVDCLSMGRKEMAKNLYRLSARWHFWGTPSFSMPEEVKTEHMRNEDARRREQEKTS